jgi:hypothetical protein
MPLFSQLFAIINQPLHFRKGVEWPFIGRFSEVTERKEALEKLCEELRGLSGDLDELAWFRLLWDVVGRRKIV